MTQTSVTKS